MSFQLHINHTTGDWIKGSFMIRASGSSVIDICLTCGWSSAGFLRTLNSFSSLADYWANRWILLHNIRLSDTQQLGTVTLLVLFDILAIHRSEIFHQTLPRRREHCVMQTLSLPISSSLVSSGHPFILPTESATFPPSVVHSTVIKKTERIQDQESRLKMIDRINKKQW